MARKALVVHRKAYTREDGTRVKASTFKIRNRGAPGRTPKKKKWYTHKVKMDWKKGMPLSTRRRNALKAHGGDYLATGRALQALANVTTDAETEREAELDARYFFAKHDKSK